MKNGQKAKIHQSCLSSTQSNISACMNLIFSGFFARHINRKRRGFMDWKMESFDVRYSCEQIAKNVHLFSFWEPFWHRQTQTKPTSIAIRSYMVVGDVDYSFSIPMYKGPFETALYPAASSRCTSRSWWKTLFSNDGNIHSDFSSAPSKIHSLVLEFNQKFIPVNCLSPTEAAISTLPALGEQRHQPANNNRQ